MYVRKTFMITIMITAGGPAGRRAGVPGVELSRISRPDGTQRPVLIALY